MLQVLCQILQTDSLVDVQSWLVSSNPQGWWIIFSYRIFKVFMIYEIRKRQSENID